MCIPDLDVLVDYPIDYKWVQNPSSYPIFILFFRYPIFSRSGSEVKSGTKRLAIEMDFDECNIILVEEAILL